MPITMSTTERDEWFRDKWRHEYDNEALAVLVENTMTECPLDEPQHSRVRDGFRFVLYASTNQDQRIEWAHRLEPAAHS